MLESASGGGLDRAAVRKLVVGFAIALTLYLLPLPDGLTAEGKNTLVVFALIVYLWATEALPLPVTGLMAGVGLVLLGVVDQPNEAWEPYAKDTIFFLLGSLILADAVTKTEADRVLAARFLRRLGGSTDMLLLGIVAISALSAMFISNHAVAAIMLPLVISILRATRLHERRNIAAAYILGIAFGAGIAGLATPSGGSRNVIVMDYMDELYDVQVSYLEWTIRAAPISLVLIPIVYLVLKVTFRVPHEPIAKERLPDASHALNRRQRLTLGIMGLTVVLWVTVGGEYGLGTIAIVGALLMFIAGILDWVDTRRRIAWGVPLIYGAALSLGQQLQATGAVTWLAALIHDLPIWTGAGVLFIAALTMAVILTNVMSDGGTAAVLAPVTLALAASMAPATGGDGLILEVGMLTAIGAAFGFLLVVANPGNVITYSSGLFRPRDLVKAGVPLTILSIAVTLLAVRFYWPLLA